MDDSTVNPASTAGTRHPVMVQKWEESERGWGCRPDGYSIHATEADRAAYVADYWATMPAAAPDEYERPCGMPYIADVDDAVWASLQKAMKNGRRGLREYSNDYPGSGGTDGWMKTKGGQS